MSHQTRKGRMMRNRSNDDASNNIFNLWKKFKRLKKGTKKYFERRNLLAEYYMWLVEVVCRKTAAKLPAYIKLDDIRGVACIGLLEAIENFDLSKRTRFHTFASVRIRGAILDELRELDFIPRLERSREKMLSRAKQELQKTLRRDPTKKELAEYLNVSPEKLELLQRSVSDLPTTSSLDKKVSETDDGESIFSLFFKKDRKQPSPDRRLINKDFLRVATRGLSKIERLIVILYFYEDKPMKETGRLVGVSESRISQLMAIRILPHIKKNILWEAKRCETGVFGLLAKH